jgi:hypothetical protein
MLLLMVEGGKPMEDAMAAAAAKIALANAAQAAATAPPNQPAPEPVFVRPPPVKTASTGCQTPGETVWDLPGNDEEPLAPPDGIPHGRSGGRTAGQKKTTMKTVAIGASYSKGKNRHGKIGRLPVHASSVWWEKATAPLAVELKSATPPLGRKRAEWERVRPPKANSAR